MDFSLGGLTRACLCSFSPKPCDSQASGQRVEDPLAFSCPEWGLPDHLDQWYFLPVGHQLHPLSVRLPYPASVGDTSARGPEARWRSFRVSKSMFCACVPGSLATASGVRRKSRERTPEEKVRGAVDPGPGATAAPAHE